MCTLVGCTFPITVIFHIFIIQCLLLDGLLCYQQGGRSNPPSPRQDDYGEDDVRPSQRHAIPSRVWNRGGDEEEEGMMTDTDQDVGMPSSYTNMEKDIEKSAENINRPGVYVNKKTAEDNDIVKNKIDGITNNKLRRNRHHNQRRYHRSGASPVGRRIRNNIIPLSSSTTTTITPTTNTTTTIINVDSRHRNLNPYRNAVGGLKRERKKRKSGYGRRRRYKKLSGKDTYTRPTTPYVHKLVDNKKKTLQGVNRYEKPSDISVANNRPPSYAHNPSSSSFSSSSSSSFAIPKPSYTPPPPLLHVQRVPDEDWDKLLGISNSDVDYPSSSHGLPYQLPATERPHQRTRGWHQQPPSEGSFDHPTSMGSSNQHQHHNPPSHEMYQADEPDSEHLEAYLEALHHMDEMSTCSAVRCKHPQPFVQYMHDPFNRNIVFLPQCTILHRCMNFTGCCGDVSRECVPKKATVIRRAFIVMDISTRRGNEVSYGPLNAQMIELVNHTECECREKPRGKPCTKRCPVPLRLTREGHDCVCSCHGKSEEEQWECDKLQNGLNSLSIDGLVCIKEGKCYKPRCLVGDFDVKTGLCPLSDQYALPARLFEKAEERRHYRRHLRHFDFTYDTNVPLEVPVSNKNIPGSDVPQNVENQVHNKHSSTGKKGPGRTKSSRTRTRKHTGKPMPKGTSKPKAQPKRKNAKPTKNTFKKSTKPARKFDHRSTFTAKDFLDGKTFTNKKYPPGPRKYGTQYNFKKQRNSKTKSKITSAKTEHPSPPQAMTMPKRRRVPKPKKHLPPAVLHKISNVTSISPDSTVSSKTSKQNVHSTTKTLRAASKSQHPSETLATKHKTRKRIKSSSKTSQSSTTSPSHIKTPPLSMKSNRVQDSSTKSLSPSTTTPTSPYHKTMPSREKITSKVSLTSSLTSAQQASTSTHSSKLNSNDNDDFEPVFNEKDNRPSEGLPSEYASGLKKNLKTSQKRDNIKDRSSSAGVDNSLEEESFSPEGSGSDAEN